jgi:hypothetical protein
LGVEAMWIEISWFGNEHDLEMTKAAILADPPPLS